MPIRFRRTVRLGPLRINVSRTGVSWSLKIGPWSWNSRTRRHSVDLPGPLSWQSSRPARRTPAPRRRAR